MVRLLFQQVFSVAIISVLRCAVAMTVNAAMPAGDIADKVTVFNLNINSYCNTCTIYMYNFPFILRSSV